MVDCGVVAAGLAACAEDVDGNGAVADEGCFNSVCDFVAGGLAPCAEDVDGAGVVANGGCCFSSGAGFVAAGLAACAESVDGDGVAANEGRCFTSGRGGGVPGMPPCEGVDDTVAAVDRAPCCGCAGGVAAAGLLFDATSFSVAAKRFR